LRVDSPPAPAAAFPPPRTPAYHLHARMRPKLLLVEDDQPVAETILYALRTDGCDVSWVATGGEALEALDRDSFAILVLDVGLPDVNGFDLCRSIRRRHTLPIVFLTARGEETDRVVGLEIGGDDYVTKPFSPRELSARVRAILRRAPAAATAAASPAEAGGSGGTAGPGPLPFAVDADRRVIRYFGQPLDLTRTEYELLLVLVRRPGRVYTRDELLERIWAHPGASTDRSVDSHVKALRAKLRAVRADREAIVTHRGQGYSLCEQW
jgi:two-component system, OmpR family, catabolic regulation response regulator CreB